MAYRFQRSDVTRGQLGDFACAILVTLQSDAPESTKMSEITAAAAKLVAQGYEHHLDRAAKSLAMALGITGTGADSIKAMMKEERDPKRASPTASS